MPTKLDSTAVLQGRGTCPDCRLYGLVRALDQQFAVRVDLCVVILCELSQTADSTSAHTERGGQGFRSPLDNLRKAVSSESGRIIRTDRLA